MNTNVALVLGVTGIVGNSLVETLKKPDAAGGPWKIYGVAQRPKPEWFSHDDTVHYIQCDLLDKSEVTSKLSLPEVTHIFWVTWTGRSNEEENCEANGFMLQTLLETVIPVAKNLKHVCLQTGTKHYLGPFSHMLALHVNEPPFREDMPRIAGVPNFYYTQEDILFEACKAANLTWSVHRPNIIIGFAPRNYANILGKLAVYAAVCKKEGLKFSFLGDLNKWNSFMNLSDADLIAEQELWAATSPNAHNQAFNIDNGDLISWKRLWHILAREFNLQVEAPRADGGGGKGLAEAMRGKEAVWEEIVTTFGLAKSEIRPETWWIYDLVLKLPQLIITCMNKSKEHGFLGFRNTEKSICLWIRRMKDKKIIPGDSFWE